MERQREKRRTARPRPRKDKSRPEREDGARHCDPRGLRAHDPAA